LPRERDAEVHEKNTKNHDIKQLNYESILSDDTWTWMAKLVCECRDKPNVNVSSSESIATNLLAIKDYLKDHNKKYLTIYSIDRDNNKPNPELGYIAYGKEMEPVVHEYNLQFPSLEEVLYCYEFHVMSCHRKKGLGLALMNKLVDVAKQMGLRRVALTCLTKNEEACEFYRKFGYKIAFVNAEKEERILSFDLEPERILSLALEPPRKKAKVADAREDTAVLEDENWSCNDCTSIHKVENPWCYTCRKWYHLCPNLQVTMGRQTTRSKSNALKTATPSVLSQSQQSCSACKLKRPPMTNGITNGGLICYIISAMRMIVLATGKSRDFLENTYGESLLVSDIHCFEQLKAYWTHMCNEESNPVPYDNSKFIEAFTRLYKPNLGTTKDKRDSFWRDHQEDPGRFMCAFFTLAGNGEAVNTMDGFHGIATKKTDSCKCGKFLLGGKLENNFILKVEIVYDDNGDKLCMQTILNEYFKHCTNPKPIGDDRSNCVKCSTPRFETTQVSIEPNQQFLLMMVTPRAQKKGKSYSLRNKPIRIKGSVIDLPTSSDNAYEKWTLKAVLLYRGNGEVGHYFVLTERGVYDDEVFTYDDNRIRNFIKSGYDKNTEVGDAYAHTYLFERVTTTSKKIVALRSNCNGMEVDENPTQKIAWVCKDCKNHNNDVCCNGDNGEGGKCLWWYCVNCQEAVVWTSCTQCKRIQPWVCSQESGGCGSYNDDGKSTRCKGHNGTCVVWFCIDCADLNYNNSCSGCGIKATQNSIRSSRLSDLTITPKTKPGPKSS